MKARAKEICILIIFVLKETENTSPCFYRVGVDHLTFKLVGGWILKALTCKRKQIHALEICWKKKNLSTFSEPVKTQTATPRKKYHE